MIVCEFLRHEAEEANEAQIMKGLMYLIKDFYLGHCSLAYSGIPIVPSDSLVFSFLLTLTTLPASFSWPWLIYLVFVSDSLKLSAVCPVSVWSS